MALDHAYYMDMCLALSREAAALGNRPLGTLLVREDGEILARGTNRVYSESDPTEHGEMVVIREVCRRERRMELADCTLYSSLEPCPMCLWATLETKVARLVLGARHAGIGRTDTGRYSVESFLDLTGRSIDLVTGVRERECTQMRLDWVAERAKRGLGPR